MQKLSFPINNERYIQNASSIDLHDDSFRRANDIRDITKNDLCFVADRSIFDVTSKQKSITKAAYNTHLLEVRF